MKNRLFWFGLTLLLGGLEMILHIIDHSKGRKLNFGDGQDYMGIFFIVIGLLVLGYNALKKKT